MAKIKALIGLPYSLAHSYFSTIKYHNKGSISDWIVNSALEMNINKIEINILNKEINPKELQIKPLLEYLDDLILLINKTLTSNYLPEDSVVEAKFIIHVNNQRIINCRAYVKGKNNKIYKSKDYMEQSYEKFNALNHSFTGKILAGLKSIPEMIKFHLHRKLAN